jgi:polyhydroxybutyrate depolymerase
MRVRHLLVSGAVILAACSGSDSDSDATPTPAGTAIPVTEPVITEPEVSESVVTEPVITEPAITEPAITGAAPGTDASTTSEPDPSDGGVLVIDGPARVRPSCDSLTRGVTDFTLDAGGGVHDVRVFVPTQVSSDPAPVVLDWHGLGSNGFEQAAFSGYETLAEEEGFVVVHPTGLGIDGGPNSWQLDDVGESGVDDLAFADALIDTLVADWCGDPDRIYSTGMSNGGFFTAQLVCERADRIAAAVSVAGVTHGDGCDPARPVPYLAFHGTGDDVVPFAGGGDSTLLAGLDLDEAEVEQFVDFFSQVMPDEFAEFAADAGCDLDPERVEETPEVISYAYTGCEDGVPMTFYEIVGGGHTWPDSPLADQLADLGFFTDDISATVDGWAFMSQFSL